MATRQGIGFGRFYTETSATTGAFVEHQFIDTETGKQFTSGSICLEVTAASNLEFSFDGTNIHGKIEAPDPPLLFENRRHRSVWLRTSSGSATVRVTVW